MKELRVAKIIREVDFLINVPKMKTHILTLVTLGMKNLKGVLPPSYKRLLLLKGLHHGIVDLNIAVKPHLTLIEGIIGQEGLGPIAGDPIEVGAVILGSKVTEVDAVGCRIMGINPLEVKHLVYAYERGLGEIKLSKIAVIGDKLSDLIKRFRRPLEVPLISHHDISIHNYDACSGCMGAIMVALNWMLKEGEIREASRNYGRIQVVLGPHTPSEIEGGLVIICGNCAQRLKNLGIFIPGCPPPGWLIRDLVRIKLGLKPIYADNELIEQLVKEYGVRI